MADFQRFFDRLQLRNFRAFEFQEIQLRPVTVFVGPNNSGKSSILGALRLLSQTAESVDFEVPLLLGDFGTFRDVVFGNKATRTVGLTVGFQYQQTRRASFEASFKYRGQRREVILKDAMIRDAEGKMLVRTAYSRDTEKQTVEYLAGIDPDSVGSLAKRVRTFHFLPRLSLIRIEAERLTREKKLSMQQARSIYEIDRICREASWILQAVQYLGPFRDVPSRGYPFSGERPSRVGFTGGGTTDILVADYFRRGTRKRELSNLVKEWLVRSRIANDFEIRAVSDRQYEILFQHAHTGEFENLADVGYGISQVLPVLVAGHNLDIGAVLVIEQPELHLHPAAQAELGEFFLHLYRRGVQSIIETHSEHLILRLQQHVAMGLIPPDHVAVNFVGAGLQTKSKEVQLLPLDSNGIFQQEWPGGFFDERMKEALNLAQAPLKRRGEL
jgi:hypothetical protein